MKNSLDLENYIYELVLDNPGIHVNDVKKWVRVTCLDYDEYTNYWKILNGMEMDGIIVCKIVAGAGFRWFPKTAREIANA